MTKETDWTARIGRRLRLRDLHMLLAVAKTGSIGKTAAELAISQPVVSKAMSDLERSLGVRLFDRGPKGVEPTRHGRALLKTAAVVFDELRQGVDTLEFLSDPTVGELRLGCTEPLAAGFVGAVIESLARDLPRVSFNIVTGDPLALKERELLQRNIELAVTPSDGLGRAGDIDLEALFDDRQVIAAGQDNKWTRRRSIAFAELANEPWILPPPHTLIGTQIAAAFGAAGLEPPLSHIESFSIPLCLRLVATGRFITMLPMSMVLLGGHPPLKLLRIDTPPLLRPTSIITLRNRTRSAVANAFIERARKMAKQLASLR